jgi:hypothetical protein
MLARKVTKWDEACDRKLHRLVCYINCTLDLKLYAWVGDPLAKVTLDMWTDADLAGDPDESKSTSGIFLGVTGGIEWVFHKADVHCSLYW